MDYERPVEVDRNQEATLGCVFLVVSMLLCSGGFVIGYAIRLMMR